MVLWTRLTGGGSVQRAKHEGQKQSVQAILSEVSKHYAGSFPIAVRLFVVEADYRRTLASNPQSSLSNHRLLLNSCWQIEFGLIWRLLSTEIALRLFAKPEQCMSWQNLCLLLVQTMRLQHASVGGTVCTSAQPSNHKFHK